MCRPYIKLSNVTLIMKFVLYLRTALSTSKIKALWVSCRSSIKDFLPRFFGFFQRDNKCLLALLLVGRCWDLCSNEILSLGWEVYEYLFFEWRFETPLANMNRVYAQNLFWNFFRKSEDFHIFCIIHKKTFNWHCVTHDVCLGHQTTTFQLNLDLKISILVNVSA